MRVKGAEKGRLKAGQDQRDDAALLGETVANLGIGNVVHLLNDLQHAVSGVFPHALFLAVEHLGDGRDGDARGPGDILDGHMHPPVNHDKYHFRGKGCRLQ